MRHPESKPHGRAHELTTPSPDWNGRAEELADDLAAEWNAEELPAESVEFKEPERRGSTA